MGATIYSLLSILWWNLIGQYMYYVYVKLSLTLYWVHQLLPRFNPGPPQWWLDTWHVYAWWNDNLDDRVPNTAFVLYYRRAAKDRFEDWIKNAADSIARPLVNAVLWLLGSLLHGYTTFSAWINAIRARVGTYIPWWATSLANAAMRLYHWLPLAVRQATATWSDIWEGIKAAVKDWARARFDAAMTWVANTAPWVFAWVDYLSTWYYATGEWLTNFKNNPYSVMVAILGTAWSTWMSIYVGILNFYNNVWVPYKITLHDFLADPLGWVYDRVEDELIRRW